MARSKRTAPETAVSPKKPPAWPDRPPAGLRLVPLSVLAMKMLDCHAADGVDQPGEEFGYDPDTRHVLHFIGQGETTKRYDLGELPAGLECATLEFITESHTLVGDPAAIRELNRRQKVFDDAFLALGAMLNA